jgi:hypothetical protein
MIRKGAARRPFFFEGIDQAGGRGAMRALAALS